MDKTSKNGSDGIGKDTPHALPAATVLERMGSASGGLSVAEAAARLARFGANTLPAVRAPGLWWIVLRQFASPLIYVLLLAAAISLFLRDWSDAGFIFAALLINAGIGASQEYGAQRSAQALQRLVTLRAEVERDGEAIEIDAAQLVPGDIVMLDSGAKVPADLRLLGGHNLSVDESLLTGESLAVAKHPDLVIDAGAALGDRRNMAYAGSLTVSGRGRGVVVKTGAATELGQIASSVLAHAGTPPPLLLRMERFTYRVALAIGIAALLMIVVAVTRGMPLAEIFMLAVALAVAAIPEGLPVALTIALAVGTERMAKRNVIVRKLVAVEALGSCTYIASDKTGTLTVNQLTVRRLQFPDQPPWEVTGEGLVPEGTFVLPQGATLSDHAVALGRLSRVLVLANEGVLARRDDEWVGHGDAADLASLVVAHKAGVGSVAAAPQLAIIPYEPERRFAASLNRIDGVVVASVKGAVETLLPMCQTMMTAAGPVPLVPEEILAQAAALAGDGYRVLAAAEGELALEAGADFSHEHLHGLTLLGVVAMTDPLRPEARDAVDAAQRAGIRVGMVTGDHPDTALAIARELGFAEEASQVVSGRQLAEAARQGLDAVDRLCAAARVFSRVEPQQKLQIVESLQRVGHFVAVTGDGVNDAPALKAAHVGVAMGEGGTDVARETAALVIADDNFASIVAGIEEGRIAYSNIRKVIFLLISTGSAEIVLFALAMATGVPLPLTAVQLLWLNLVTNGIQDVALAFEPAEGDELRRPPRPPRESIFNRVMLERVLMSGLLMGALAYAAFVWLLDHGVGDVAARNCTLLLMVLFENVQAFNSRSETRSLFRHSLMRNRLLLFGAIGAQALHIGAMYTPGISTVLGIQPVTIGQWAMLLVLALVMLAAMEIYKWRRRRAVAAAGGEAGT